MMLGWSGINYPVWLYTAWVPEYLQTARNLDIWKSGWLSAIPFLFGALGMALSGLISDLLVRRGIGLAKVHRLNVVAGMLLSATGTFNRSCFTFPCASSAHNPSRTSPQSERQLHDRRY